MNYLLKLVIVVPRGKDSGELEDEDGVQKKRNDVDYREINQCAIDAIGSHLLPIKIRPCSSKMMVATTSMVFILIQND
ncbi:MAG: hypothetical protein IJQ84_01995 [Paludibacteraceae bacterium]|nr:hypothetical protein [Paludibacteraceae bacterium]MBQ6723269.1 hypothetical protein [Paludibacteraceae bacterium]